jgi:hypothetical protein
MFTSCFTIREQEHRQRTPYKHDRAIGFADHCVCHVRAALRFTRPGIYARALQFRVRGPRGKKFAAMKAKRSTPCRKSGSGRRRKEQQLCDAGLKPIPSGSRSGIRPDAPSRIVKPKSTPANAASTTPAISRFTAPVVDMAKRPSVILPQPDRRRQLLRTNERTYGGFYHVNQ